MLNRKSLVFVIMMFLLLPLLASCSSSSTPAVAQESSGWVYKGVSMNENDNTLHHYVWEKARAPLGPWDKIQLHRYVKEPFNPGCIPGMPPADPRKVLFFNPGTWDRAIHATQDNISQQWYFAANGYDFYAIDFRTAFLPYYDYDQFVTLGLSAPLLGTSDWTYDVFREDIKACVDLAKQISGSGKIFMSGFSRGGTHTLAYAAKYASDLKGMILLDGGTLYRSVNNPATQRTKAQFDEAVASFKAGTLAAPYNLFLSDGTGNERTRFGALYPNSRNTVTRFPTYTVSNLTTDVALIKAALAAYNPEDIPSPPQNISDVLAYSYYWAWGKAKLTNIYGGYNTMDVLLKYQSQLSRFWPVIQNLEGSFLTGYANCPFLDYVNTTEVTVPILFFGSELGCPGGTCRTPGAGGPITKSTDVTIVYLQGYGHVDVITGSKSLSDVKTTEMDWMNSRL